MRREDAERKREAYEAERARRRDVREKFTMRNVGLGPEKSGVGVGSLRRAGVVETLGGTARSAGRVRENRKRSKRSRIRDGTTRESVGGIHRREDAQARTTRVIRVRVRARMVRVRARATGSAGNGYP